MPHQDGVDGVVLSNICGMNLWPGLKPRTLLIASICVVSITACLPPAPSAGRGERVRSVVVLGDSITWGFFGVTPGIQDPLSSRLAKRGISLRLLGFPGDSIAAPWPGRTDWPTQLQRSVSEDNPDVSDVQIRKELEGGADLPQLQKSLKCGTFCGSCVPDIKRMAAEHIQKLAAAA